MEWIRRGQSQIDFRKNQFDTDPYLREKLLKLAKGNSWPDAVSWVDDAKSRQLDAFAKMNSAIEAQHNRIKGPGSLLFSRSSLLD